MLLDIVEFAIEYPRDGTPTIKVGTANARYRVVVRYGRDNNRRLTARIDDECGIQGVLGLYGGEGLHDTGHPTVLTEKCYRWLARRGPIGTLLFCGGVCFVF